MARVLGSWTRAAVIRGDITSTGLVLILAGVGGALVGAAGVIPAVVGSACAVGAAGGVVCVYLGRTWWRELLDEVVDAHDDYDPGDSPVPWVSDDVWRARNAFDPALDAPVILMAEVDPLVHAFGADATGAFTEPVLRPVTPEERGLAVIDEVPHDVAVPEAFDIEGTLAKLTQTPGRFVCVAPRWPICCGRLACLETVTSEARPPGVLYLPPQSGEASEDNAGKGIHTFQCRACGRRYATDPAW